MAPFFPSVLFVDDNPVCLLVAEAYLARYGFNVIPVPSADEALAFLSHHRVQAVVTDCDMPETNGMELARIIKHRQPNLPVFIRSGRVGPEDLSQSGADKWFMKGDPFSVLLQALQESIKRPTQSVRQHAHAVQKRQRASSRRL